MDSTTEVGYVKKINEWEEEVRRIKAELNDVKTGTAGLLETINERDKEIVRRGKIIRRAKKKAYETKSLVDEAKGALRTLKGMMGQEDRLDKVDTAEKGSLSQLIDILDEVNDEIE